MSIVKSNIINRTIFHVDFVGLNSSLNSFEIKNKVFAKNIIEKTTHNTYSNVE